MLSGQFPRLCVRIPVSNCESALPREAKAFVATKQSFAPALASGPRGRPGKSASDIAYQDAIPNSSSAQPSRPSTACMSNRPAEHEDRKRQARIAPCA